MSSEDCEDADVRGDLGRYPFPRLMFYLYKNRFSGRLDLRRPSNEEVQVFFRDGLPAYVEMRAMEDVLGRVLLERGWITTEQFESSLAALAQGEKRHGQLLLEMGAIDPRHLINALRLQLRRKINRLFQLRDAPFGLYAVAHDYGQDSEGQQVCADPLWLIHQGVRNTFDSSRLAPELRKLRHARLQLNRGFATLMPRYGLATEEQGLAELLMRGPQLFERVFQISNLSRLLTEMLLYTFWVTEALVIVERAVAVAKPRPMVVEQEPVSSSTAACDNNETRDDVTEQAPARSPAPPASHASREPVGESVPDIRSLAAEFERKEPQERAASAATSTQGHAASSRGAPSTPRVHPAPDGGTGGAADASARQASSTDPARPTARRRDKGSAAIDQLRVQIEERLAAAKGQNHFELLGLTRGASTDDVHTAYFKLAKEFHPDRVSGIGLDEQTCGRAHQLFSRIAEANGVLSDSRSRADYEKSLDEPEGAAEEARALLEAEMTFQRATVFFRKRDYRQALEQFQEAYRLNDREGEHLAWIAWTRWCDPRSDGKAMLPQLIADLKKAITISPRRAQSHYFLGELLLASGDEKRAIASFEAVVEINRNHVDALRQLRLIRMRQGKGDKKPTKTRRSISRFLKK